MKNLFHFIVFLFVLTLASCGDDNQGTQINLQKSTLESMVQTFEINGNVDSPQTGFTTAAGCKVSFVSNLFWLDGKKVEGPFHIDVVEIFDRATMATTGRHTMAEEGLLISGGQFFINAYQGDKDLEYLSAYSIEIPAELTSAYSPDMQLFEGGTELLSEEDWVLIEYVEGGVGSIVDPDSSESYNVFLREFGWFNVDRYYNDPRPKTELIVKVPSQYSGDKSVVYVAIKNEPNSLGIGTSGLYPIGLEIHLIFVSQSDSDYLYQIISTEVEEGKEYRFENSKIQTATLQELEAAIRALD